MVRANPVQIDLFLYRLATYLSGTLTQSPHRPSSLCVILLPNFSKALRGPISKSMNPTFDPQTFNPQMQPNPFANSLQGGSLPIMQSDYDEAFGACQSDVSSKSDSLEMDDSLNDEALPQVHPGTVAGRKRAIRACEYCRTKKHKVRVPVVAPCVLTASVLAVTLVNIAQRIK